MFRTSNDEAMDEMEQALIDTARASDTRLMVHNDGTRTGFLRIELSGEMKGEAVGQIMKIVEKYGVH